MTFLKLLPFLLVVYALIKNLQIPTDVGNPNQLAPCPSAPNCVRMEIPYHEGQLAEIESFFQVHYNGQTLKKTPNYLHLVVTTPLFRFKDDVECLVDQEKEAIVIRSASRLGYYDFNSNSLRIKKLLDSI